MSKLRAALKLKKSLSNVDTNNLDSDTCTAFVAKYYEATQSVSDVLIRMVQGYALLIVVGGFAYLFFRRFKSRWVYVVAFMAVFPLLFHEIPIIFSGDKCSIVNEVKALPSHLQWIQVLHFILTNTILISISIILIRSRIISEREDWFPKFKAAQERYPSLIEELTLDPTNKSLQKEAKKIALILNQRLLAIASSTHEMDIEEHKTISEQCKLLTISG